MVKFLETFLQRIRLKKGTIFAEVDKENGSPVGPPFKFTHFAQPDRMRSEAQARLQKKVQQGLRANAIRILDTEPEGGGISISTAQPCWVWQR